MARKREGKAAETRTTDTDTKATGKPDQIKLELFDGDTIAMCDPETGICTVPNSGDSLSGAKKKPRADKGTHDRSQRSDN